MFRQFYVTTKDRKGGEHNYKLDSGDTVPSGQEIVNLAVAGRFKFSEVIGEQMTKDLKELFPTKKSRRAASE